MEQNKDNQTKVGQENSEGIVKDSNTKNEQQKSCCEQTKNEIIQQQQYKDYQQHIDLRDRQIRGQELMNNMNELQISKIIIEQYDKGILLGALLHLTGLTVQDVNCIIDGTLVPKPRPQDIKKFIIEGATLNNTFLKRATELQVDLEIIKDVYNKNYEAKVTLEELNKEIYNFSYIINTMHFSLEVTHKFRNELVLILFERGNKSNNEDKSEHEKEELGFNKNQLAKLFSVSPTTISNILSKKNKKKMTLKK